MTSRVAINGLGRIGRSILKLVLDDPGLELVAVNDLVEVENLAYMLRFDTVYGRYARPVSIDGGDLVVAERKIRTVHSRDPAELPWQELNVDLVFECTGALTRRADLEKHLGAGASFVLLSAPSKDGEIETVVHRVNAPGAQSNIVSCASCTTNCITPIVEVVGRRIGLRKAIRTTVHANTSSQSIIDGPTAGSFAAGGLPVQISYRPAPVPRGRRRAHCRNTTASSTGSRCVLPYRSARSRILRSSRRGKRRSTR